MRDAAEGAEFAEGGFAALAFEEAVVEHVGDGAVAQVVAESDLCGVIDDALVIGLIETPNFEEAGAVFEADLATLGATDRFPGFFGNLIDAELLENAAVIVAGRGVFAALRTEASDEPLGDDELHRGRDF